MFAKGLTATGLVFIYFLLSFNAFACLIPLYSDIQVTTGSDCAMPGERPARQQCDAYKSVGVQSIPQLQPLSHAAADSAWSSASVLHFQAIVIRSRFLLSVGSPQLPQDPLLLGSILRI